MVMPAATNVPATSRIVPRSCAHACRGDSTPGFSRLLDRPDRAERPGAEVHQHARRRGGARPAADRTRRRGGDAGPRDGSRGPTEYRRELLEEGPEAGLDNVEGCCVTVDGG